MKDRANNPLSLNDEVLYLVPHRSTSSLAWGIVVGFTPKMAVIRPRHGAEVRREGRSIVKPLRPEPEHDPSTNYANGHTYDRT